MTGCSVKTRKRHQLDDGGPSSRRYKFETKKNSSESLNIVDLDNRCLESIFMNLNINDLLNVALSSSRLSSEAAWVFKRKYGSKCTEILFQRSCNISKIGCFLEIRDLRTCLQFLRCFGKYITKLKIVYMFRFRYQFALIDQYIDEYCAQTVKEVHFLGFKTPEILVHNPRKPFFRVERVSVMDCKLGRQLPQFVGWFPNLQLLDINWSSIDWSCAEINFPHLQHLRLFDIDFGENLIGMVNVAALLRSNPQLKILEIESLQRRLSFQEFSRMISENKAITTLKLPNKLFVSSVRVADLAKLTRLLPRLLELDFRGYSWEFTIGRIIDLIHQADLGQLRKITFWSCLANDSHLKLTNGWQAKINGREITLMR